MRHAAAADLEFEEAARIRDEIKRLQAVELTIADDPFARQSDVDEASSSAIREVRAAAGEPAKPRSTKGRPGTRATKYRK